MHRRSSSSSNTMAPCSCGLFHPQGNCFSMLFSMPNNNNPMDEPDSYNTIPSPSSSSVDCTLSLGTPSTRQTKDKSMGNHHRRSMSNLCWDIFQTNKSHSSTSTTHKSSSRGSNGNNGNILNNLNGDPLFARRCANCDTTSTPLWRNGPRGPKSLCNACGIRYKKEERRATSTTSTNNGAATAGMMESQYLTSQNHRHSWGHHAQSQKVTSMSPAGAMGNEFRFIEDDDDRDSSNTGIPFISWRLNVPDRHSFVHEFS